MIEEPPLCNIISGDIPFFKGKFCWMIEKTLVSCFFWASFEGINLLKASDQLFFDCTFRSVPRPFTQLLIIMGHHKVTRVYFPGSFISNSRCVCSYGF